MNKQSIIAGRIAPEFLKEETLAGIFSDTIRHFPDKPALIHNEVTITYRQLDEWTNAFAALLQSKGLKRGDCCMVWWPRGIELHVAIISIVKCGATYVPMDFDMPEDRVASVMNDCGAQFIITSHEFTNPCIRIDSVDFNKEFATLYTPSGLQPDDLAYILFTSGSTGKPKGIPITHRNICHLLRSENEVLRVNSEDKVYQGFSVSFDMWCEESWISYLTGATLWVADSVTAKAVDELSSVLQENEITVLHAVPSLLAVMDPLPLPKLRIINAGGEACTPLVLEKWADSHRRFFNSYGPTETTVSASFAQLSAGDEITIGKPLANYGYAVVDEQLTPVPVGTTGELVVTGPGVGVGYLHLEKLTSEKFLLKNEALDALPGARMYRTGDAVFMDESGNIHFNGRLDDQVKLRGYRIELGEIENVLSRQEGVLQAAVALKKDGNDQDQLTAYVVLKKDMALDEPHLKEQLAAALPQYMVPFCIAQLTEFPRLPSGKINRKQLPVPEHYLTIPLPDQNRIEKGDSVEVRIKKILCNLFAKNEVDLNQDFFTDLGGHSLLAAAFVSKVRQEGKITQASLKDVYQQRPLTALCSTWEAHTVNEAKPRRAFNPIPRLRYLLCFVAQSVSLLMLYGLLATEIFFPYLAYYFTLLDTENHFKAMVAALLTFCLIVPVFAFLGIAAKWIIIGRYKEGEYPLWGTYYFRWWLAGAFQRLIPTQFMNGTPLYPVYLRLMGARVAADAQLSSFTLGASDLIEIDEDVTISSNVVLNNAVVEDGLLKLSRISIGKHAYAGSSSVIGGGARMEDYSELQDQSHLEKEKTISSGEIWKGSPARLVRKKTEAEKVPPLQISTRRRALYKTIFTLLLLVFPFFVLIPLAPTIVIISELDNAAGDFEFYYLWVTPFLSALYILLFALLNISMSRLLQRGIKTGVYSIYSRFYIRKWLVDQMNAVSLIVLHPIYATVYISAYFRGLGARVGKNTEISTASNVTHPLFTIGDRSFIADAVTLGESDVRGQRLILEETRIGSSSFVGNSALIPQGYELPDNMLIGVLSVPPTHEQLEKEQMRDWFGSPAIAIPKRQDSVAYDISRTFSPPLRLKVARAIVEFIRIILPQTIILIGSIYFIAYASEYLYDEPLWKVITHLPFYYLIFLGAPVFIFTVIMKWIVVGKYKPSHAPMWSFKVWRSEMMTATYEALSVPFLLEYLKGTAWLPFLLRFYGVKTGKRNYLNTTDFTEFDVVKLGDDVALNEDCGAQTHLFEDRVMKIGEVTMGDRICVGSRTIILYNSMIEDDVKIEPLSLVMKGETLQKDTTWVGSPVAEQ